jgi:hypothetical protein
MDGEDLKFEISDLRGGVGVDEGKMGRSEDGKICGLVDESNGE